MFDGISAMETGIDILLRVTSKLGFWSMHYVGVAVRLGTCWMTNWMYFKGSVDRRY
jgi:hypothetical protein